MTPSDGVALVLIILFLAFVAGAAMLAFCVLGIIKEVQRRRGG